MSNSSEIIHGLQWFQHNHDDLFHRDISVLAPKERVAHLSAHVTKYGCRLAVLFFNGRDKTDDVKHILIDMVAICLSLTNVMKIPARNIALDESHEFVPKNRTGELYRMGQIVHDLSVVGESDSPHKDTVVKIIDLAGKIAKAVEAWDHIEDYPFVEHLREETVALFHSTCAALYLYGLTHIEQAYFARLTQVQQKNPFFTELHEILTNRTHTGES